MTLEATGQPVPVTDDESPEFLGRPYNLVDWRSTRAEREFFRTQGPKATEEAPDFTLPSLGGGDVTLSSLRGLPVVIEFGSMT